MTAMIIERRARRSPLVRRDRARPTRPRRPRRRRRRPPPRRSPTTSRSPSRTGPSYADWRAGTARRHRRAPRPRRAHHRQPGRHHRLHRPAHRATRTWDVRHLDVAGAPGRLRRQRAGRLLERRHPRRHLDPGRAAGHLQHRRPDPLVRDGPLGLRRRRTSGAPASTARATRGPRSGPTRSRSTTRPPACCCAAYQLRLTLYRAPGQPQSPRVRMLGAMSSNVPDRFTVTPSAGPHRLGHRAGRPALLAEHPRRPLPGVRRRRRGLVLPDLHRDGGRVLGPASPPTSDTVLGRPDLPGPDGQPRRPDGLRLPYDGAGNWPFNTAYAATLPRAGGAGDPAALPRRAGALHRGRHPGGHQPVLPRQRAGRRQLRHLRATCSWSSASPPTATSSSTTPPRRQNDVVRNVYKREQFEQIWLRTKRTNASGGTAAAPAASPT